MTIFLDIDFENHYQVKRALVREKLPRAAGYGELVCLFNSFRDGSGVMAEQWDWYLFMADRDNLEPLAQCLRKLPREAHALVVATSRLGEELIFVSAAQITYVWVSAFGKDKEDPYAKLLKLIDLPEGLGYAYLFASPSRSYAWRRLLMQQHGFSRGQIAMLPLFPATQSLSRAPAKAEV